MAITLYGFAATPSTDDGTNTADPTAVTPPADMQKGDLVIIHGLARTGSLTLAISETGGQTWNAGAVNRWGVNNSSGCFWCVFDGTWDANPSVSFGATTCNSVVMLVFRPNGGTSSSWQTDQTEYVGSFSAPADPYTVTIPGAGTFSTQTNGALVVAKWGTTDNNTWGSLTGSTHTWTALSQAQFRNSSGSDQSLTFAWLIDTTAGDVGTVSQNEASLGGDGGVRNMWAWKEVAGSPSETNVSYMIL